MKSPLEIANIKKGVKGFITIPFEKRFYEKVKKTEGCWYWTGAVNRAGYGETYYKGRKAMATRAIWQHINGAIPKGMYLCHKCDEPACVRIEHLFVGTPSDNMWDASKKGRLPKEKKRKLYCSRGHLRLGDNIYELKVGTGHIARYCRECLRINDRKKNERRKHAMQAM